ncbi:hypothetical protein FOQG_17549 [Fusarium oxysporum f. sp. raphani 54005]|uniref:Uncharacterized protein n=1 Tax=Fusarium oxysporum f. sp. raphani 54005 TaxID=1089458 RepID=X0B6K6_FUSOX|nr:hypothetical protein FOQG_17549 [Fusarium oxysporum f. sp. raphani 54005]
METPESQLGSSPHGRAGVHNSPTSSKVKIICLAKGGDDIWQSAEDIDLDPAVDKDKGHDGDEGEYEDEDEDEIQDDDDDSDGDEGEDDERYDKLEDESQK